VQSIAAQTFRNSGVDAAVQRAFEARLITLSNVHGVLTQRGWDSADLHAVVSSALRPHAALERERFTVAGPALRLGPKSAVALSMAVHELCTNAIKYGASDKPVEVTVSPRDRDAILIVRDHGPGIPPEHLPRLTERFYRVDAGESRAKGSTGLGLAIVKHILARHRGRRTIESGSGQGATFSAILPLSEDRGRES